MYKKVNEKIKILYINIEPTTFKVIYYNLINIIKYIFNYKLFIFYFKYNPIRLYNIYEKRINNKLYTAN